MLVMNEIDEVKSRLDIVDYINQRVPLKKSGRNFKGLCPFHGEKTPSFMVSPDRQSFHCFGCAKGGSIIDFYMEYNHVEFREALEELAQLAGVTLSKKASATPQEKKKEKLLEIHHLTSEYYHYLLTSHKVGENARMYLKERGVTEKIIKTFNLGYSANSWDGVTSFLKKKGYDSKDLELSGLFIPSQRGGYDRFRGRVMFPIRDHRGQTIAFSGRLLDPDIKEAKYINSPETPLYIKGNTVFALDITKQNIQKEDTVVLMEGEFDVLSSFQVGIGNAVAIKGTALTEAQIHLLKRYCKKIIFALDSDIAGDQASRRGIEIAERNGLEIYVAQMPVGKDPDDVARSNSVLLKTALTDALSLYDFYVASAIKRYTLHTAYGKKGFTDELLPIFYKIENPIIQGHYIRKVAELVSLPEQTVTDAMQKAGRNMKKGIKQTEEQEAKVTEDHTRERLLLALLLQGDTSQLILNMYPQLDGYRFEYTPAQHIIDQLFTVYSQTPEKTLPEVLDTLPPEYKDAIDQALLMDINGMLDEQGKLLKTIQNIIKDLKKRQLKSDIRIIREQLQSGEEVEQEQLQIRLNELIKSLQLLDK
jgi:DNA primase